MQEWWVSLAGIYRLFIHPHQYRLFRVVDDRFQLLQKGRRNRGAAVALTDLLVRFLVWYTGMRMQHHRTFKGIAVGTVEPVKLVGITEFAGVRAADPVPAEGGATASHHIAVLPPFQPGLKTIAMRY